MNDIWVDACFKASVINERTVKLGFASIMETPSAEGTPADKKDGNEDAANAKVALRPSLTMAMPIEVLFQIANLAGQAAKHPDVKKRLDEIKSLVEKNASRGELESQPENGKDTLQ